MADETSRSVPAPAAAEGPRAGSPSAWRDGHGSASALAPALIETCQGRLSHLEWFRAPWQNGGATTGFGLWDAGTDHQREVLVKFPVGHIEYLWTLRLGAVDAEAWHAPSSLALSSPRVVAAGEELGGHDLAWIIVERLRGPGVGSTLTPDTLGDLMGAAADFHARALLASPVNQPPPSTDWERVIERARARLPDCGISEPARWKEALKKLGRGLDAVLRRWNGRQAGSWCHGDLHPGNAMYRLCPGDSRVCVLIDFALVHAGHWVEDGVYLERQYWGHEGTLGGVKPVSALAQARRVRGLPVDNDYTEIANLRRVLMAAAVPVQLAREGNAAYVRTALETLERLIPQVCR